MPQPVVADTPKPVVTDIADNGDVLMGELRAIEERRAMLADPARGPRPIPAAAHDPVTPPERKSENFATWATDLNLSALCLSGGGIRSAAFALGVVQGLAARKILRKFDYLSTVSGGGYTGAMLTAWVQRAGYDNVEKDLVDGPRNNATISPLQHLRRYSSYLSPSAGLLSTDMLALVALYIRNLLLNWFVLIPILLAAIITLKWVTQWAWTFQAGGVKVALFGLLAVALAGSSMVDSLQQRPGWGDEASSRSRFLALELLPTLLAGLLISVAALKIYQQAVVSTKVDGGSRLLTFLTDLQWYGNVAVVAAGTYFVAAVLALSFSPPRDRDNDDKSTSENIRSATLLKGILIVLALTASGAVVGLLLARIIDAIGASSPDAISPDTGVSPVRVFLLMCLGPSVFMIAVFLAELLYCALTGWDGLRATTRGRRCSGRWRLPWSISVRTVSTISTIGRFPRSAACLQAEGSPAWSRAWSENRRRPWLCSRRATRPLPAVRSISSSRSRRPRSSSSWRASFQRWSTGSFCPRCRSAGHSGSTGNSMCCGRSPRVCSGRCWSAQSPRCSSIPTASRFTVSIATG
jgi:hypothetical protein